MNNDEIHDEIERHLCEILNPPKKIPESTLHEQLQKKGFMLAEGKVNITDLRLLNLPFLDNSGFDSPHNRELMKKYQDFSGRIPTDREIFVRIVYGEKIFEQNASIQAMFDLSLQTLVKSNMGAIGMQNTPENLALAEIIDMHLQSPEIPISIIHAHGSTDQSNWLIANANGEMILLPEVLNLITAMDRALSPSSSRPKSPLLLVSCNEGGAHTLQARTDAVILYRSGKPGGSADGSLEKVG